MTHPVTLLLLFTLTLLVGVKAQSPFTVELKVVVDSKAVKAWSEATGKTSHEEFKKELISLFVEVGELYNSLANNFNFVVKFVLKELILDAHNVVDAPNDIVKIKGLRDFENWMLQNKPYDKTSYDIALLFTGNDVVGDLLGLGMIGEVCKKDAIGMIQFTTLTYRTAFITAHEIGHILGMIHDGEKDADGNKQNECDDEKGYIMSSSVHPESKKKFEFSDCSYLSAFNKLHALPWECLHNGAKIEKAVTGPRMGEWLSADETCRRSFGKGSYLDRDSYWIYGDEVCSSMLCITPTKNRVAVYTPQGMECGKSKQCIKGKCMKTDKGKSDISDVCPFGDQPEIDYKGYKTCSELPLAECGVMKSICCKRCNLEELSVADNHCRKITKNPKMQMVRSAYVNYGRDTICEWLACGDKYNKNKNQWNFKWKPSPPGMICGQNKRCQGKRCLPASDGNPNVSDNCPFGDQPRTTRSKNGDSCLAGIKLYLPNNACQDSFWKKECCASCGSK